MFYYGIKKALLLKSTELKLLEVLVFSGKKNSFSEGKARMKQMNKNIFILFYFSHAGLTYSYEIPYVVFFLLFLVRFFFSARVVPVFSFGLFFFFGTVT